MQDDRREFTRVSFRLEAHLSFEDGAEIDGESRDISMNGTFVEMEHGHIEEGTEATLTLSSEGLTIRASAVVTRVLPRGLGIKITALDLDSYRHLKNLVLYNADDADDVLGELSTHLGLERRAG